jgi:hypothetical protein
MLMRIRYYTREIEKKTRKKWEKIWRQTFSELAQVRNNQASSLGESASVKSQPAAGSINKLNRWVDIVLQLVSPLNLNPKRFVE